MSDLTREQYQQNAAKWLKDAVARQERAHWLTGGRRCAVRQSESIDAWWVGESPRNGEGATVEGGWDDWVTLAHKILEHDKKIQSGEEPVGIPSVEGEGPIHKGDER